MPPPPIAIETAESGAANFGAQGGGEKLVFILDGYTSEAAVYNIGYTGTAAYLNGFIRNDIAVEPLGGFCWRLTVSYGTTGMGGGPYPLGGPGSDGTPVTPPTGDPGGGNASEATELKEGFSFGLSFKSKKVMQSLKTMSVTVKDGTAGGWTVVPPVAIPGIGRDFKRAIGVSKDGEVQGCDFPSEGIGYFKRQVARATVTIAYYNTLLDLIGKTNNAPFFSQKTGCVLAMGVEAEYQQSTGWTLTHNFAVEREKVNLEINSFLTVPLKRGWEYYWCAYREVKGPNGLISTEPFQVNVEKIVEDGDFSKLEIGV